MIINKNFSDLCVCYKVNFQRVRFYSLTDLTNNVLDGRIRSVVPELEAMLHERVVLVTQVLGETLRRDRLNNVRSDALLIRAEEDTFANIVEQLIQEKTADVVESSVNLVTRMNAIENIEALQMNLHRHSTTSTLVLLVPLA